MIEYSKYNLKKDLKVTYLLGAGASYNSVPIWSEQGESMELVADSIKQAIENPTSIFSSELLENSNYTGFTSEETEYLNQIISDLKHFSQKAQSNDTIDIYANILFKRNNTIELDRLKKTLSIYLDIWQFYQNDMPFRKSENEFFHKKQPIDTRYIKWLNMITESDQFGEVSLNPNINILSWNYDLQTQLAFNNLYQDLNLKCLDDVNAKLKFLEGNSEELNLYHLNGHHGYFKYDKKYYPTGRNVLKSNFYRYLKDLFDNLSQFKVRSNSYHDYSSIKFSWEKELSPEILNIANKTDILVVIGYSFPQYNRKIDSQILNAVKSNTALYIYYQDPMDDFEKIKNFINYKSLVQDKSVSEFFVPDEFINPKEPEIKI